VRRRATLPAHELLAPTEHGGTLLRSLSEVVSSDPQPPVMYGQQQLYHPADVAGYMGHMHMSIAMDKPAVLGNFLRQASDDYTFDFSLLVQQFNTDACLCMSV
jgi:hypothetical protein